MAVFLGHFRATWSLKPFKHTTMLGNVREKQPFLAPVKKSHTADTQVPTPILLTFPNPTTKTRASACFHHVAQPDWPLSCGCCFALIE